MAFRREITVYPTGSFVTHIQELPPGYQVAMDMMRDPDEPILETNMHPDLGDYKCPYCGNRNVFFCRCGVISCHNPDAQLHECPNPACRRVCRPQPAPTSRMSGSGFLEGGAGGRLAPAPTPGRLDDPWSAEKIGRLFPKGLPQGRGPDGELRYAQDHRGELPGRPQMMLPRGAERKALPPGGNGQPDNPPETPESGGKPDWAGRVMRNARRMLGKDGGPEEGGDPPRGVPEKETPG
jgi:hypothetical protein